MLDCKCKVCGKEFRYGDENSPCLIDEKWEKVVNFYNLGDYEKKASMLHSEKFNEWEELNDYDWEKLDSFEEKDEYHLYICYNCMEKALGRKITHNDLPTPKAKTDGVWYYNKEFEENYFK
jgi:hypothetical protein